MPFGVNLQSHASSLFPETLASNNVLFRYTGQNYDNKDQANLEARYTKREGYYVRVVKRGERYGVYAAEKR